MTNGGAVTWKWLGVTLVGIVMAMGGYVTARLERDSNLLLSRINREVERIDAVLAGFRTELRDLRTDMERRRERP